MHHYNYTNLSNLLVLDIEAVREYKTFQDFLDSGKSLDNWKKVSAKHYADVLKADQVITDEEIYLGKAGLYAEYAKVVCIGLGRGIVDLTDKSNPIIISKSYDLTSHNEYTILKKLAEQLEKAFDANPNTILAGHNIVEYDLPFLAKRMIKHKIKVPTILINSIFSKPWEMPIIDTMKDWKMNTSKYMSMDTICEFIGIPSSKHGEVNGSNLGNYYWNYSNLWNELDERNDPILGGIAKYCKHDVANVIDIFAYLCRV
jgi:hypothetical protein